MLLGLGLLLGAQVQQEGLVLLTDRGYYISGETINYRAFTGNRLKVVMEHGAEFSMWN